MIPQPAPIDDNTISESINGGRFEDAKIRIAFRQMKALEAIAKAAEAVGMGSRLVTAPIGAPGRATFVEDPYGR